MDASKRRLVMRNLFLTVFLLTCLPVVAAADEAVPGDGAGTPSPAGASVSISAPEDGEVVPTTFTVKFMVSGMAIAPAGSQIDNTGHHHLLIDIDELPPMNAPLPANDQIIHFGGGQTETELTLPPGDHSLQLVFGDYAHRPHDPPVISDKITVTVSADFVPEPAEDDQ
jgi:hypothetical protein